MACHLRGQARYPFKPLAATKRDQASRARRMVAYAYRYVPYYRETMDRLGLRPADFQDADDLARLPLLEREQLQRDPEYFVSTAQPMAHYVQARNSGSTGKPCTFYFDARTLYQYAAHNGRARAVFVPLIGKSVGYRKTKIMSPLGSSLRIEQFYRENTLIPRGVGPQRQCLSLTNPPETNVPLINGFKPDIIQTYGSYLAMLLRHLRATGQLLHRPKALLYYTSDSLPESARRLIEKEFHIPVFGTYEAAEAYNIGFECQLHTGLHLNIDLCPVRIVDPAGKRLPDGECGEVVISNLINRATVLLNYRLGDVAATLPSSCPCGRSLPLLSNLLGRSDDWIELPSGQLVHPQAVPDLIKYCQGVWQYQVVQRTVTHFDIALVTSETCDREETRQQIASQFERRFGENITVDVRFVDSIERTAAGKVRPVISLRARSRLESAAHSIRHGSAGNG
jgi:phenylacetate-CoA ligase